jgi:alcohol oxidase
MCGKLRPSDEEIAALGPDFQKDWDKDFKPFPTRPLMLCGVVNAFLADPSLVEPGKELAWSQPAHHPIFRGHFI